MAFTERDWISTLVRTLSEVGRIAIQDNLEEYQIKVRNVIEQMPNEIIIGGTGRSLNGTQAHPRATQTFIEGPLTISNEGNVGCDFIPQIFDHGSNEVVYATEPGRPVVYVGLNEIGRVIEIGWNTTNCVAMTNCINIISGATSCVVQPA